MGIIYENEIKEVLFMYHPVTDLAAEARSEYMSRYAEKNDGKIDGVEYSESEEDGFSVSTIDILNEAGEHAVGKPCGRYVTLSFPDINNIGSADFSRLCTLLSRLIQELCGNVANGAKSVLVCGLGNERLSADAFGQKAAKNVIVTRHLKEEANDIFAAAGFFDICAFYPDVSAHTGLDSSRLLRAAVKEAKPDVIIAVDALCARGAERICKTVQLCTAGISPGAGVGNAKGAINAQSMGVPVISLGVPTVIDAATLVRDIAGEEADTGAHSGYFVCPKDIDTLTNKLALLAGYAINRAFHGDFSLEEMMFI